MTREFTIYVAGQLEEKFAAGGHGSWALQRFFSNVQMGLIHVDKDEKKKFMKTRPPTHPVTFTMPVKDGVIFLKRIDEVIKVQIFVNDKGEERFKLTTMVDEDGIAISVFLSRDGNQMRLLTGQPSEDEYMAKQDEFYKEKDREAAGGKGTGGGGTSKAELMAMMEAGRAKDKEEKRLQDVKDKERREEKEDEEKAKNEKGGARS